MTEKAQEQSRIVEEFAPEELNRLKCDPSLCSQSRRTFLKWSALAASQVVASGGVLNLLTGEEAKADDTMANVASWVYSVCGYCSVGCGMYIGVNSSGKAVFVKGNDKHPTNSGRVCVKGVYEWKILDDSTLRVGARGKYPLLRNAAGGWDAITWDQATTLLAQKIVDAVNISGPDSVGIYNTGQWTLEEYYSMGKLGKGAIGSSTMDSNTRLCMAAAVYGYMSSFGSDGPPGCYDDIEYTDCFFLIGTNPAEMHPQAWRRILNAYEGSRSPKMIVVDPRRTATARTAGALHLRLKPGTNVALMNGLIQQIIANNWIDSAYVGARTRNYSALAAKVAVYTPAYVSGITGVPAADIELAARWLGTSREVWSMFIQGVYQSMGATDTVRLICAMHLIMGKIGRPGSAPFSITGQTTAMSNREVGGSSALSGYRNYYNEAHVTALESLWKVPAGRIPRHSTTTITSNKDLQPINSMVDMMRNGQLKVFWVACTNPAVTLPDLNKFFSYAGYSSSKRPFVVLQDIYDPIETKAVADLFLPAAMWGEKTGTYTCSERRVNLGKQAVNPAGYELRPNYGAYSDLDIIKMVADKLALIGGSRYQDLNGKSLITYTTPEACFNEWKTVSAGRPCDMSGMTYANLESNNGVQWPSIPSNVLGGTRLYTDGLFNTNWDRAQYGTSPTAAWIDPDNLSRAYLWAADYIQPPEVPDATYPFWFNTGRVIEHFHSRTKTKRVAQLHEMVPEQYVEIHPDDAATLKVVTGNLVKITSRRGEIVVKARVTDTVVKGQVFVTMHFGDLDPVDVAQNAGRLVAANRLTINYIDLVCYQPIYKHCAVKLAKA